MEPNMLQPLYLKGYKCEYLTRGAEAFIYSLDEDLIVKIHVNVTELGFIEYDQEKINRSCEIAKFLFEKLPKYVPQVKEWWIQKFQILI